MMLNATTTTKIINTVTQCYDTNNQCYNFYYNSRQEESMDVPFYSYLYTLFLGVGCFSFLNPTAAYSMMVNLGFFMAQMLLNGYIIYNENIYRPFNRYIYKPISYILNIQEMRDEIMIIKDGVTIYSFNTMEDFIKNNPINFIRDKHYNKKTETEQRENDNENSDKTIDTVVDADLTNLSTDFHKLNININENHDNDKNEDEEDTEDTDDGSCSDESDGTDESTESEDGDEFILDPREYDFLLRNLYYESETEYERHNLCFKYETFRKSDLKTVFTNEELLSQVSKRKLVGANIHMDSKKYSIDLINPMNYFIVDNSVLGYWFLKWYMAEKHDVILEKKYSVFCIDNCIGMYELGPGKKLQIYKDTFKVEDDKSYIPYDSDEEKENNDQTVKSEHSTDNCDIEVVEYD